MKLHNEFSNFNAKQLFHPAILDNRGARRPFEDYEKFNMQNMQPI